MSRGLGWLERKILRVLRDAEGAPTLQMIGREVRMHTFTDTPEPPRHRPMGASAVSRAVQSLARKGLVRTAVLYHNQRQGFQGRRTFVWLPTADPSGFAPRLRLVADETYRQAHEAEIAMYREMFRQRRR